MLSDGELGQMEWAMRCLHMMCLSEERAFAIIWSGPLKVDICSSCLKDKHIYTPFHDAGVRLDVGQSMFTHAAPERRARTKSTSVGSD